MMAFKCHFVLSLWLFFCASSFLVYGGGKDASSGSNHSEKKSLADLMVEERLADRDGKPLNELLKFDKIDKNELDAFLKENEQLLDIAFADYNPQNVQLGDHAQSETPSKSNKKKASMGEQMLKKLKEKLIRLFAVKKNDPVMAQIMENLFSFIKKIIKGESPQKVKHYLLFTIKIFALREEISLSENMPKNKIEINHSKLFKMVLEESNEQKEGNSERRKTILTSLYDEVGSLEIPSGIEIKSQKKGKRKSRRKKRVADIVFSLLFALAIIIAMCAWHWAKYKINEYKTKQKGLKINANLPKHTIDEENSGDCPICLAKFEVGDEFPELQCKHKFHTECIGQWLKMQNTCPYCRATTENASKGKANAQGQPQQLPRGK